VADKASTTAITGREEYLQLWALTKPATTVRVEQASASDYRAHRFQFFMLKIVA